MAFPLEVGNNTSCVTHNTLVYIYRKIKWHYNNQIEKLHSSIHEIICIGKKTMSEMKKTGCNKCTATGSLERSTRSGKFWVPRVLFLNFPRMAGVIGT